MADQGKWFKLWESSLDDQDLENLSVHEWFCWARFGTYLKKHGKDGKLRLRSPATAVTNLLRLPTFSDVINMLKRFPNYTIEEGENVTANVTNATVTLNIICLNWSKYQGDFSGDRVRKHRRHVTANVTVQEERRRDVEVEEKRFPQTPTSLPAAPSKATTNGNGQSQAAKPKFFNANPNFMEPKSTRVYQALKPGQDPWAVPEEEVLSAEEIERTKAEPVGVPDDVF